MPQPANSPILHILIGNLKPGERASATYAVRVLIESGTIINQAHSTYVSVYPSRKLSPMSTDSNKVIIPVVDEEE
ncbi:hypothetical protein [Paenibacillus sp. FJAT-27812]|uniref:hypothetical protein n=1 Tax=Paenibacillus sp. FJAT-27812 TaxID=1684143 RepID=UPI0006A7B1E8|nr:hypothetical protein [Paenibacillus sp. FJAT-27812]